MARTSPNLKGICIFKTTFFFFTLVALWIEVVCIGIWVIVMIIFIAKDVSAARRLDEKLSEVQEVNQIFPIACRMKFKFILRQLATMFFSLSVFKRSEIRALAIIIIQLVCRRLLWVNTTQIRQLCLCPCTRVTWAIPLGQIIPL